MNFMKKELEEYLWNEICSPTDEKWHTEYNRSPRAVIEEMIKKGWINSPKQAHATINKWIKKGIYEYGSCFDLGWKTKPRHSEESSTSSGSA